ncbi:MAG: hypothetical protein HY721_02500 [Planctomycetes bacterium]|nr:hypothetical protein [Planctomycetota bacterium]
MYPGGHIPLAVKAGAPPKPRSDEKDKKDMKERSRESQVQPQGDPHRPTYKLVLKASSKAAGLVTFYGKALADRYACTIHCRLEKRREHGEGFVLLRELAVEEGATPARGGNEKPADLVRQVYDAAVEKLARQLAAVPPFSKAR